MKFLVIGSTAPSSGLNSTRFKQFRTACNDLGKALQKAEHKIVIMTTDKFYADRYVAEGAGTINNPPQIEVIRPRNWSDNLEDGLSEHSDESYCSDALEGVNLPRPVEVDGPWSSAHIFAISRVDGVIAIGGGQRTRAAYFSAPALQKPVLAIPSFGGATQEDWSVF